VEMRGLMGGLYRISEWIMRLSGTNLMWFIFSIPFFFTLIPMLVPVQENVDPTDVLVQMSILAAIVAPFTLFPATTAMFSVVRKWVMGDVDVPLIKTFWKGFRENYKQSMLGGFMYAALGAVLSINYTFYSKQAGNLSIVSVIFIVLMILLLASLLYFFSILSHLHMKTLQIVKNALMLTVGNPLGTIVMVAANLVILYFSFLQFTFLIPFFMGSLCATATFYLFYKTYLTIQIKQEQWEKEQREKEEGAEAGAESSAEEELTEAAVKPVSTPEYVLPQSSGADQASQEEPKSSATEEEHSDEDKSSPKDDIYIDDSKYTQFHKKFKE
jgi:uncharacterized membrane protein YesL